MDSSQLKCLALCVSAAALAGCGTASKSNEYVTPQVPKVASVIGDAEPGDRIPLPKNNSLGLDTVVVERIYTAASGRQCRRLRQVDGRPIQRVACQGSDGVWSLARDLRPVSSMSANTATTNVALASDEMDQSLVPSTGSLVLQRQEVMVVDEVPLTDAVTVSEEVSLFDEAVLSEDLVLEVEPHTINADTVTLGAAELDIETVERTVNLNETLWSFAKRTTGNALNWKTIARLNGITNAKTLTTGTQLLLPAELVGSGD